jgi:S1-C subfamily serine protease
VLTITPQYEPIRVGISWRMDDAEPDTAIISQVIFGSAAQQAGVQVGDRVYELGGQRFGSEREFVNLLATARDPFPMLLERDGQLRLVTLRLLDAPVPAQ